MVHKAPDNEAERLADLHKYHVLDTPPTAEFDDLVRLAAIICNVPIAAVSLVDSHRQWFKAATGLTISETPRDVAFCSQTILNSDVMIVPDAQVDERYAEFPLVTGDPNVRFYAGAPLISEDGFALGALCVMDSVPRSLTEDQQTALQLLARQASSHLSTLRRIAELKSLSTDQTQSEIALQAERDFQVALLDSLQEGIVACDAEGQLTTFNRASQNLHGAAPNRLKPDEWTKSYDLYLADGITPMQMEEIPLYRALQGDTVQNVEMVIAPKTGGARFLLANGQAFYGEDGVKLGAVVAMHDITERKEFEAKLAESEARLRRLSDAAMEGICVAQDGYIIDANAALVAEMGYSHMSEMIGREGISLTAECSRELARTRITSRNEDPYEAVMQRADGTTFLAELRGRHAMYNGRLARITAVRNVTEQRQMERELRERDEKMRAVLESAPIILYTVNQDCMITFSEGRGLEQLGLQAGESVGLSIDDVIDGDQFYLDYVGRVLAGESVSFDASVRGLTLHTELRPIYGADGQQQGFTGVCLDVSERVASEQRFKVLFEQSSHAHFIFDETEGIIECNRAALAMLRCSDQTDIHGTLPYLFAPQLQPDGRRSDESGAEMCRVARQNGSHTFQWQTRALDGFEYPIEVTLKPVTLSGKSVLLSVWNDMSERKLYEQQLHEHSILLERQKAQLEKLNFSLADLATTDGLTGLKNHRAFQEQLVEEVDRAERYNTNLSLIILDVDRFKEYNDAHGHPAGDVVLKEVGKLLQDEARNSDTAARYGGEEFVLLLPMTTLSDARIIAERMRELIESHMWPQTKVTASLGLASLKLGIDTCATIIERADEALYNAKRAGRNCVSSEIPN